jgi:hypothetical protein
MNIQLQKINLGDYADDGTGDDLRTAFAKVNLNFDEIKTNLPAKLAEDPNPKLAGNLDLNSYGIKSNAAINVQTSEIKVTGRVIATEFIGRISDISNRKLDELEDVAIPTQVSSGQVLKWDGTQWTAGTIDANITSLDGGFSATVFNLADDVVIDGGFARR